MTETTEKTVPIIDLDKARELLAAAVDTKGRDFVYKLPGTAWGCDYFPKGDHPEGDPRRETGCLVGVALALHGIDVSKLFGAIGYLYDNGEVGLTLSAAQYFQVAQLNQDEGSTWGDAYDMAEKLYREDELDTVELL